MRLFASLAIVLGSLCGATIVIPQSNTWPQVNAFEIPFRTGGYVGGASVSPDGRQVVVIYEPLFWSGNDDVAKSTITLWNVGDFEPVATREWIVKRSETPPNVWRTNQRTRIQYCDHGRGIMLADSFGTISFLDPQTLQLLKSVGANVAVDPNGARAKVACAMNGSLALIVISGRLTGRDGHGKLDDAVSVKVVDLNVGTVVQQWSLHRSAPVGDVAISPSGAQIAITYVPMNNLTQRPKAIPNLELLDVTSGKTTLQVKTGHLPGGVTFVGESRVATADVTLPGLFGQAKIKIWDSTTGQLLTQLADPNLGARRKVAASSDGAVVLGYIPHELVTGNRASDTTLEQRFRLWDEATGATMATSPPLLPLRTGHQAPDIELSANGRAAVVSSVGAFPVQVFYASDQPKAPLPTSVP
jgi:hypothetical protein